MNLSVTLYKDGVPKSKTTLQERDVKTAALERSALVSRVVERDDTRSLRQVSAQIAGSIRSSERPAHA